MESGLDSMKKREKAQLFSGVNYHWRRCAGTVRHEQRNRIRLVEETFEDDAGIVTAKTQRIGKSDVHFL